VKGINSDILILCDFIPIIVFDWCVGSWNLKLLHVWNCKELCLLNLCPISVKYFDHMFALCANCV